jgi:hypothetical protein
VSGPPPFHALQGGRRRRNRATAFYLELVLFWLLIVLLWLAVAIAVVYIVAELT